MSALPSSSVHHPARVAVAVAASFVSGVGVATQTRINGELGSRLGDGFTAAAISFGSGLLILVVLVLALPGARAGMVRLVGAVRAGRTPWWYLAGGLAGAMFVLGQGLLAGILGVALFTVGIVAGQTVSSLLVDRRGLGTMPARRVSAQRLVGAVLAVAAVAVAGSGELGSSAPLLLVVVPVILGLFIGVQPALNGQVRGESGSAVTATFVNFAVGAVVLVAAALVHAGVVGWPMRFPTEPWLYLGGTIGVVFIALQTVLVRILGVLLMGLAVLAGQLAAAVVYDLVLPVPGHVLATVTLIGAAVTLLAVGVAAIPARRIRATSGSGPR